MSRIVVPSFARPGARHTGSPGTLRALAPATVDPEGTATIRLYEEIDSLGWWGISAEMFAGVLDSLPREVERIALRVNSPGGDVFDGIAITNMLRAHPAHIVVTVDGLAASIASVIAMAGDELVMAPNSEMMIHDGWGVCRGNAAEMAKAAQLLDHLSDNIAGAYAARAGGTAESWRERMIAETWYSADEAVAAGLADRVDTAERTAAKAYSTEFTYAGRAHAPAPCTTPDAGPARAQVALIRAKIRKVCA